MIRIQGVNLPDDKRLEIALTALYGIGRSRSLDILEAVKISRDARAKDLTSSEEQSLRDHIEDVYSIEGELKREKAQNIKHLRDAGTYRGTRHAKGLPSRGQRTKTNSRTVRGNVRRTAGSGRKSSNEKT